MSSLDWTCHRLYGHAVAMTETGWQAIGRIAKARRERLGLKQDELVRYGGPAVATVGKFERAAQESFPTRTQHQMENALGWGRTIVEQVVNSIDEGKLTAEDWEYDLIHEDVPDLSNPILTREEDALTSALETIRSVLRLMEPERLDEAVRRTLVAILPLLSVEGATALGAGLREAFPPEGGDGDAENSRGSAPTRTQADYGLVADEDDVTIEDEQEQTEQST